MTSGIYWFLGCTESDTYDMSTLHYLSGLILVGVQKCMEHDKNRSERVIDVSVWGKWGKEKEYKECLSNNGKV